MEIVEIDKTFQLSSIEKENVKWIDATQHSEFLFGVYYEQKLNSFCRMPLEIAENINEGVMHFCTHTSGGRLRLSTNSPFFAIKAVVEGRPMYHMPFTGNLGFGLYVNGKYTKPLAPNMIDYDEHRIEDHIAFQSVADLRGNGFKEIELYFPQCRGVKHLYIGVEENSEIKESRSYTYMKPVIFYGSSITQGCCTCHPGNDYEGHLSRWLDCNFLNLGFSGSAQGEALMAEYVASLDASVFVIDYDHNAPDLEHLKKTHCAFYEIVRKKNPNTPIILLSRPDWGNYDLGENHSERRAVIYDTYKKAKKNRENVWFIDGEKLFDKKDIDACTVDTCHPNDLGFYRMAKNIRPALYKALKKSKK